MTSLQEPHDHSSQYSSADKCSTRYTLCHILVSEQCSTSSLLVLFGQESMPMLGSGPKHVYSVSARRFIVTRLLHCLPSQALMLALTTSTSTSLDHFHLLKGVPISSPASIDSQDGQKPSPSPHRRDCCPRFHLWLDLPLWYTLHSFHGQRTSV